MSNEEQGKFENSIARLSLAERMVDALGAIIRVWVDNDAVRADGAVYEARGKDALRRERQSRIDEMNEARRK